MVFSNSSTKEGIVEEIDFLVNSNSDTYPIAQKTRNVNRALDDVVSTILGSDGRWQWDDTNYTTLPIGTADLISGQQDYTFESDYLVITRIEMKDSSGNWQLLRPFDQSDYSPQDTRQALSDLDSTDSLPYHYDKIGNSIMLYPATNYNSTGGLKAYFQRTAEYFTTSDTTKEPGFAPHLHRFLSLSAAYDYALAKGLEDKKNQLRQEMEQYRQKIVDFYSYRPKDRPKRIVAEGNVSQFNRDYR
jgi:hypothetical protein